jgi:hypothetical protein
MVSAVVVSRKIPQRTKNPVWTNRITYRTEYSDTLFTTDEYDFLDARDAALLNKKRSRKASKYDHITQTRQLTRTERDRYQKLNEER